MRDDQLRRLVDLARDKREAERILAQIRVLEQAMSSYEPSVDGLKYTRFKSAILAILAYLDEIDKPVPQEQLISVLLNGGWRRGDDKAETNLKQSIASFTRGLGRKTKQIKMVNGLIGRGEWPDKMFSKS